WDNFFELGGDSIKALQVSSRLYQSGYKLDMKDLFQHPTVEALSPHIKPISRIADQGEVRGAVQLTPVQQWFFEQSYADSHHHNQAVLLYRDQGFVEAALHQSVQKLAEHHDVLRLVIREAEDGFSAWNRGTDEGELYSLDVIDLRGEIDEARAVELKAGEIQSSIRLDEGPFMRLGLFRCKEGDHLLIAIHHLVVDGVSWRILFEDLATAYEQAVKKEPIRLPQKTDSFRLWAEQLADYANSPFMESERAYWEQIEQVEYQPLPKDFAELESLIGDSETVTVKWTEQETELLLKQAHRAYRTDINDLLLAALGMAVHDWTKAERVVVSLEGHGREAILPDIDISRTVGWFTSQYPVVLDMSGEQDVSRRIKMIKEGLRSIPQKGIGYGILRYLAESCKMMSYGAEPEISFNYLGQFDQDLQSQSMQGSPYSSGDEISKNTKRTYVLDINGLISEGVLSLTISYSSKQYRRETMERLTELFHTSLQEVVDHCVTKEGVELTPSDLSIKRITAEELEQIVKGTRHVGEIENIYKLTPMQQGMLFHSLLDAGSSAYFEQTTFDLSGRFDMEIFGQSLAALMQRHEIFRSNVYIGWRDQPLQIVCRSKEGGYAAIDLRGMTNEEQKIYIERRLDEDKSRGFDLTKDALMRVTVLRIENDKYHFIWSSHHILMDGWCLSLVTEEVFELYFALLGQRAPQLAPVSPYSRYIEWLETRDRSEALAYWGDYLSGYEQQTVLPASSTLGKEEDKRFASVYCHFGKALTAKMNQFAKQHQVTSHTLLQTAWGLLLQKYNGSNDVVFGSVVSGRPAEIPGIENMIGLFINTIPVRIRCEESASFEDVVVWNQNRALASHAYDTHPLYEIQTLTEQKQELIHHIMVFENFPVEEQMEQLGSNGNDVFEIENVNMIEQTNYDFNLIVTPGDDFSIRFEYNEQVFAQSDVERMQGHLVHLLEQAVANPHIRVSDLEVVTEDEKAQIFDEFNATAMSSP
ncbi:condensation domain-containing protein, partial [Paenibacillus sp. SI8]|uniref:condensation domain-containing protein n=1 Tax=unclassified Paenibacillus TaxID=185978 RepID=UPI0034650C50